MRKNDVLQDQLLKLNTWKSIFYNNNLNNQTYWIYRNQFRYTIVTQHMKMENGFKICY